MSDADTQTLAEFVASILEERHLSIRALAAYAGISHPTVRRILAGKPVDPETIHQLATYLKMPASTLFRMAGLLPDEEVKSEIIREVEHLMAMLPEESQRRIRDMVRLELRYIEPGRNG